MSDGRPSVVAPICLIIGALLGMAGSFAPSDSLRGLEWGVDGIALVVGAALLLLISSPDVIPTLAFSICGWAWWCRHPPRNRTS